MHGWLPHHHLGELLVVVLVAAGAFVTYAVGRALGATLLREDDTKPPALGTSRRSGSGASAKVRPLAVGPRGRVSRVASRRTPEWGVSEDPETGDTALDPAERRSA
jgi:hypothetical protein